MPFETIAVISPGNMGSAVGAHLKKAGYDVVTDLTGRSDHTKRAAERAGIRDAGSLEALVREADLVLSILAPALSVEIAGRVAEAMARTGAAPFYADCNATSPKTAKEIAAIMEKAGAAFIDVGIIGGAPTGDRVFPRFCASGSNAHLLDELDGKGVSVVQVGPEIGQGSAIKICNGAFTKGAFALYASVMMAAEHFGFADQLRPGLQRGQAGTAERLDEAMIRLPSLAPRYIGEMEQVAETLESIGLTGNIHTGAAEIFRLLAETPLAKQRRDEIEPDRTSAETVKILASFLEGRR
jgi:3-hydroxyisobutyrate dehydrogenase-like beta-hydroxyacid dehydrogenase